MSLVSLGFRRTRFVMTSFTNSNACEAGGTIVDQTRKRPFNRGFYRGGGYGVIKPILLDLYKLGVVVFNLDADRHVGR